MKSLKSAFAATAALLLATLPAPAVILSIDNGIADTSLGAPGSYILDLNSFTAVAGVTQVNSVLVAFGSVNGTMTNGEAVSVYVWSDPNGDGNPSDAQVLGTVNGLTGNVDTDTFETYTFSSPVTLTTNSFFVGYTILDLSSDFPISLDTVSPLPNRTWFGISGGAIDPNNLGAANVNTSEGYGFPGNTLIRADVSGVPEPAAFGVIGAVLVGAVAVWRRRSARA